MSGIPNGLIRGGQGRRGTDCLKSAFVLGACLLGVLLTIASAIPSIAEPPCATGGGSVSLRDAAPPHLSDSGPRGGAAFGINDGHTVA